MLTLQDFENQIDPVILERGRTYYRNRAISFMEEFGDNSWHAAVEGSETYAVELSLTKKGEIRDIFCSCPYDGPVCKHAVALLFALRDELKKTKAEKKKPAGDKKLFETLLQQISLEEFQAFIRQYAAGNRNFRTEFELFFAGKDDRIEVGKKYEELIRKLIRKHSDQGFIDYRNSKSLAHEVGKILETGAEFLQKNNFRDAFRLAAVVVKLLMKAETGCDDSGGYVGDTISGAIQLLDAIAGNPAPARDLKTGIMQFLEKELADSDYFDYGDFGLEMLEVFKGLALQLDQPDAFLKFLDTSIRKARERSSEYKLEYFLSQKVAFLREAGKSGEAEKLAEQNLDIVAIRQEAVNKAIAAKDFAAAKKLIAGGIEKAREKGNAGTVVAWEKDFLEIAVLENDIPTVRRYTRQFALQGWFNRDYYRQWKATYAPAEWEPVIKSYISGVIKDLTKQWETQKGGWRPAQPPLLNALAPVYIEEKYWGRLLELLQKENNLYKTLEYHAYLAPHYPEELVGIYVPAFEKAGQVANNRSEYASLVHKMEKVMQDIPAGKDKIVAVARSLKEQFPKRRAMIEELDKILKSPIYTMRIIRPK